MSMLTIQTYGQTDVRTGELMHALAYPPARVVTAVLTLLGGETITAAFTHSHESDDRKIVDVFALTPSRLIACHGEGAPGWELSDGFTEDSRAEARSWLLSEVAVLTTTPGKEWAVIETMYSVLGLTVTFRDGTEVSVPGDTFAWDDHSSRERIFEFVAALVHAQTDLGQA